MPSQIKKRTWCVSCQEFELFESHLTSGTTSKTSCDTCGNEYVPYSLSEVPEEKIQEQRARYKKMKKEEFIKMLSVYQDMSNYNMLGNMMSDTGDAPVGTTVREDDAGQEAIDSEERAQREASRLAEQEFKAKYHGAQRNDKCRCDSGLKYKKCCLPKVDAIQ
jgi:hypothetical protein